MASKLAAIFKHLVKGGSTPLPGALSDRRQREHLDGKIHASVDMISGALQGSILKPLLFILYTSKLFRVVGYRIVSYADDTTIYAVIPRPLLRPQVMKSLNQCLAAIKFWCVKWHVRLNHKKKKSMTVS